MKNLTTGIMTLFNTSNTFNTAIGGRLFKGRVPEGTPLPYAMFFVVSDVQADTFKDTIADVAIQFSLFSGSSSSAEIEDMYTALKALFDDAIFTVTGNTIVSMIRQQAGFLSVPADTVEGTEEIWQYDIDYNCILQRG